MRNLLRLAVTVGVIVGAVLCWTEFLKDRLIPKRWGVVEPGYVYRSGQISSALIKSVLKEHGIRIIVDLNATAPNWPDQVAEKEAAAELGVKHGHYQLNGDGTGDIANYAEAIRTIVSARQQNIPVLVHCAAGAQRTGGVIAAYRMLIEKKSPELARSEMMRYGWDPSDDKKLTDFLDRNMLVLAKLLVEMGVLSKIPEDIPQIG